MIMPRIPSQSGSTYLGVIFFIAVSGVALSSIAQIWTTERQRQREVELIRVGLAVCVSAANCRGTASFGIPRSLR
jgi:hypothetical protein